MSGVRLSRLSPVDEETDTGVESFHLERVRHTDPGRDGIPTGDETAQIAVARGIAETCAGTA